MIQRLDISAQFVEVDANLKSYIVKKIGSLDRFIPKRRWSAVHGEVKLTTDNARGHLGRICEIVLYLPEEVLTVKESTTDVYAAIDLAEEKRVQRLKKYKELHGNPRFNQRMLHLIKHKPDMV